MRRAWFSLVLLAGCLPDASQAHEPMLTKAEATAVVIVSTQLANVIAQHQPAGTDNTTNQSITFDEDITCTSGTGHLMGTGAYVPTSGQGIGFTTFDASVSLVECAFGTTALSATLLPVRGVIEPGSATNNLTFRGEVSWPPMTDPCTIAMKVYGASFEKFTGTVCAYGVTPQTIGNLP